MRRAGANEVDPGMAGHRVRLEYTASMATVERLGAALRESDVVVGQTRVLDVRSDVGEDSEGTPAIFFELTLSDPPAGLDTWPVDDIWEIRRVVQKIMAAAGPELEVPWFLSFVPESSEDLEPEDARDQVDVDD